MEARDLLQLPLHASARIAVRRAAVRCRRWGAPFRHRIRVRWNECDLQGVVFYANYLMYFDVAMTELWREAVEPFGDMNATGADMVVAEARIAYRASARFDDELDLVASVRVHGRDVDDHGAERRADAGRRAARRGQAAARVRGARDAEEALHSGAGARRPRAHLADAVQPA